MWWHFERSLIESTAPPLSQNLVQTLLHQTLFDTDVDPPPHTKHPSPSLRCLLLPRLRRGRNGSVKSLLPPQPPPSYQICHRMFLNTFYAFRHENSISSVAASASRIRTGHVEADWLRNTFVRAGYLGVRLIGLRSHVKSFYRKLFFVSLLFLHNTVKLLLPLTNFIVLWFFVNMF